MSRPSQALIDLNALSENYRKLREFHGGRAFAVLKANAYGHGAVQCARVLDKDADAFAVAFLKEGVELKEAGIGKPILLLEGVFDLKELHHAANYGFWIVVHQIKQIEMIEKCANVIRGLNVWIKLETGMNRLGLDVAQAQEYKERLYATQSVSKVSFLTHLACADVTQDVFTINQVEKFTSATRGLRSEVSISNSAGVLNRYDQDSNWARLGIAMYGINPVCDASFSLEPVMELKSHIFAVKNVLKGEVVGYGGNVKAIKNSRIGLVAIGYADGYPRRAVDSPVLIDGCYSSIFGVISMDMLAVDITELGNAGVGTEVELWGKRLSVSRVASCAQTIAYELLCGVKRIDFKYHGGCQ